MVVPLWHHVSCFFKKGNKGLDDPCKLHGFDALRWDDQQTLLKHMGKLAAAPAKTADAAPAAEAETTTKKKRGKRKRDDAAGDGPAGSDAAEEEARVYNDALWKLRDDIRKNLAMSEMRAVLEFVFTSEPPHPPPPSVQGK
jgi:hypothetical protein